MRRPLPLILVWLAILLLTAPLRAETVTLGQRSYLIDLPANPAHAPILIGLHGGGGNPRQFARNSGLSAAATAQGYAVIYPAGSGRGPLLTWNGGYCCGYAQRAQVDDLAFLDAVVADAAARFGLDAGRVYLTGMSNGAILAEAYAATRPGRVKAVAAVSGTDDLTRFPPQGPVALLHIHGTADDHVPYAGGPGQSSLTDTDFTAVDADMAAFAAALGPGTVETRRPLAPSVTETTWSLAGQVWLKLLTLEGGGHVWPGGRRAGGAGAISADDEILAFFAAHP